jgi:Porin PorA
VVSSTSDRAVVAETDVEAIQGLPDETFNQQYVLDRGNSRNLTSDQSWAYTPTTKVDRSPYWSVNLPFETGNGPYEVWKNEVGAGYPFVGAGTVKVDGVTLQRLKGQLANAPVQDYYVKQLGALLPSTITPEQIDALFAPTHYNRALLLSQVAPLLSRADAGQLTKVQNTDVALDYRLDVATTLLVEPRTGAICDLAKVDQTLYAVPDLAGIRTLQKIFSKPDYASKGLVVAAGQLMTNLIANTPRLKGFNVTYSQTPASVADIVGYAKNKGEQIDLVKKTIPLSLLLAGIAVIAIGLLMAAAVASGGSPRPATRVRGRPVAGRSGARPR